MRRLSIHLLASGSSASALLLLPALAFAAPPSLPDAEPEPPPEVEADAGPEADVDAPADDGALTTADGQPMPTDTQPAGPGEDVVAEDGAAADSAIAGEASGELDAGFDSEGEAGLDAGFDSDSETASSFEASDTASEGGAVSVGALGLEGDDGPGMVAGRREPTMNTLRSGVGLFYTQLADVGGKYTFRFQLNSDFFVKNNFFCCEGGVDGDRHARVRGAVNLGFTFTEWTEVYFNVNSSANRNTRDQGARQDPPSVFALGDMNFGVKGAYRFLDGGVGLGGHVGLGLLSGSDRLRTSKVNFDFSVILGADLRYLTQKEIPVRITGNMGWTLDNSPKLVDDWGAISDPLSREVLRFSSGVNHSRVNTKLAVDFPIRLGKNKQYGLDPVIEYSWDIATYKEEDFVELTEEFGGSPLQRSQAWLTLGLRANVYDGLFLNAAVDVGTTSPSYEFGPPVPPYQVLLGLGWSFDPKPRVKQVAVPVEPEGGVDQPVLEGRILGRVADLEGNAVADAKVSFPGLASNVILTDTNGMFTSFRFPEGPVTIQVELPDGSVVEQMADVRVGEDANVDILVEPATSDDPVFDGTFVGDNGEGIPVEVVLDGMGIQESFYSDELGRIAIALPLGDYKATIKSEGYADKDIEFSVTGQGALIEETLEPGAGGGDGPAPSEMVETPLIRGNKYRIRVRKGPTYSGDEVKRTDGLDELATYLKQHPEYLKVQVRVHTDDRGNPRRRSQGRADAVVAYLVGKGVDASRLEAKGYGDRDPVAVNITPEGRRKNNRTEFKVRDYDESKVPAGASDEGDDDDGGDDDE